MSVYEAELQDKLQRLMWLAQRVTHAGRAGRGPMADPTRGQGRVLAALKMQAEVSTRDLAYLLGIRPQSLNEVLSKLEKKDLLTRAPSAADKRVMMVKITEKGRNQEQQVFEFSDIFSCLSQDEQRSFGEYLDRICAALEEQLDDTSSEELEWMNAARERLGENFDLMLAMRRGWHPGRPDPRTDPRLAALLADPRFQGGFDDPRLGGGFAGRPRRKGKGKGKGKGANQSEPQTPAAPPAASGPDQVPPAGPAVPPPPSPAVPPPPGPAPISHQN